VEIVFDIHVKTQPTGIKTFVNYLSVMLLVLALSTSSKVRETHD
jgi:hypothetical protein